MADRPTAEELTTLGEHVRSVRSSMGLSIDAAAARGPMSPVTWTKVERGEPVNPSTYAGVERSLMWPPASIGLFFRTGELPVGHPAAQGLLAGRDIRVEIQDTIGVADQATIDEDLATIDQLPVPATKKLALMRRYLRLVKEASDEAAGERRHSA